MDWIQKGEGMAVFSGISNHDIHDVNILRLYRQILFVVNVDT